jgi:subtilisin family serine protease
MFQITPHWLSRVAVTAAVALALAASGYPASAGPVTDSSTTATYIVVLRPGAEPPSVMGVQRHLSIGLVVNTSAAQARRLARHPSVAFVERDQVVHAFGTQADPVWGLDRLDERDLPDDNLFRYPDARGAGTTVHVIDTGVRVGHNEFAGRASNGWDFIDNDSVANDCNGHGTHVAATAAGNRYGVAKRAAVVAVRVLDCEGSGSTSGVIAGVDWVTRHAPARSVANMSLGSDSPSPALNKAVAASIASGVTYTLAAGNSGLDACIGSPSSTPTALTVAATNSSDSRPAWSNYGRCVDVFAPGVGIKSAWNGTDTATRTISGTSMAAPHVAGAAALVLQRFPGYSPAQVGAHLVKVATVNKVRSGGLGSPNRLLYVDQ